MSQWKNLQFREFSNTYSNTFSVSLGRLGAQGTYLGHVSKLRLLKNTMEYSQKLQEQ